MAILCSLLLIPKSHALGKMGHRVLCQLTYDLLPEKQQVKINQLLQQLPRLEKQRINQYNYLKKNSPMTFANSCTWADAIKNDDSYDKFKPWHYLNVNRDIDKITQQSCQKHCLTTAIPYHTEQLASDNNPIDKAKALMFLGHWLGDIHQPLHVGFVSDLGGNKIDVVPFIGRCDNLHWYWDQCLLLPRNKNKTEKTSHYYQDVYRQLYNSLSKKIALAPQSSWQNSEIVDWANESLTIVRDKTLNYCQISNKTCQNHHLEKMLLSQAYHQEFNQLLKIRILQGATRLAKLIDTNL